MTGLVLNAKGLFDWSYPLEEQVAGSLCVVGAPSDHGNAIKRGAALAPAAVRAASLQALLPIGKGRDWGDVAVVADEQPEQYLGRLGAAIEQIVRMGRVPLLLGGDHSLSYAAIEVLQRNAAICVVWLDAHTDFSPWQPGHGHNHRQVLRRVSALPNVGKILQIGYRGMTVGDERNLGPRATVLTSQAVRLLTVSAVLEHIPEDMPCYLSLDVDVMDPQWVPGTTAPVPDGLEPDQVLDIVLAVVKSRRMVGIDLMELNPRLDIDGRSCALSCRILTQIANAWQER